MFRIFRDLAAEALVEPNVPIDACGCGG